MKCSDICNALLKGIKLLKQESCEDTISRQAVLDIAKSSKSNWIDNSVLYKRVNELPSVTPQPKTDVLGQIRAEIEEYRSRQLTLAIGVEDLEEGKQVAIEYILAIIAKYQTESVR